MPVNSMFPGARPRRCGYTTDMAHDSWKKTISGSPNASASLTKLYKDDINLMYKMCRFELALKPKENSVWCAVFKPEEVTVLNYAEELKNYYGSGYGLNASEKLNCLVVQDLLTVLNSTVSPNVVAYFADSLGLQMLLVSLGIAKDNDTLRADNFEKMANRKWKLSELVPFGANFVAVKYNCNEAADNVTEKAVFFLNEKALEFEGCKKGLCNWSDVLKRYKHFSDANCKEFYCKEEKPKMTRKEFKEKEYEEEYEEYDVYIDDDECNAIAGDPEGEEQTQIIKEEENKKKEEKKEKEALHTYFETAVFTINGGEIIAPLMVTTLLTVIVRQLL
ncbi:multiple inositol polyphosphate phosphatase 1-like isoform X2 [Drosophila nasuta]|uniref:multiple inositol polyphosphate phosphatase 1-like isoform X2 n=1 Tax=Drosophila nasuta TaxID=42062 RepID=UPI00295F42D2|nr:multiple inositol polyphosphate phosphatase 1-like isoform X2 [Drosophila nasuta]